MGKYSSKRSGVIGRSASCRRSCYGRRGLTLLECMWALVIVSLAVVAIAHAVTAGQMQSLEALHRERAIALAEDLMEEILALPYDPVSDDGIQEAARWLYDDATDYGGFSEGASALTFLDRAGQAEIPYPDEFQRFARSAVLTECRCGGGVPACDVSFCSIFDADNPPAMSLLTITVTVLDDQREMLALTRIRTAEVE